MRAFLIAIETITLAALFLLACWYAGTLPPIFSAYREWAAHGISIPWPTLTAMYWLIPIVVLALSSAAVFLYRVILTGSAIAHKLFWGMIGWIVAVSLLADFSICSTFRKMDQVADPGPETPDWFVEELWRTNRACMAPVEFIAAAKRILR